MVRLMVASSAGAFWSYAHEDDKLDRGNVLTLAALLRDEFSLITGEEMNIFVDREAIEWGQEWRARIDNALVATTFFIPVLTPRYFSRPECRRELLDFVGQAESLGVKDFVMPILYVDVPGLQADNQDEAIALTARMQYVDWRPLRVAGPDSSEFRAGVHKLAQRLAAVSSAVEELQALRETATLREDVDEAEAAGLVELTEEIGRVLPDWLEAVEGSVVNDAQHRATAETYLTRLRRLERAGAPASARFAVLARLAEDELPLAQRHREIATRYLSRTVELDPLVHRAIRAVEEHGEGLDLLVDLRAGVAEAMEEIRRGDAGPPEGWESGIDFARRFRHVSRRWKQLEESYDGTRVIVAESNALVSAWAKRLAEVSALHEDGRPPRADE